jgi:competence protein ComEC
MPSPHLLAGSLCAGLVFSLAVGSPSAWLALAVAALAAGSLTLRSCRAAALALALLLAGCWWGSVRLEHLERSVLTARVGESALARLVVTGPARRSEFAVRAPVRVLAFDRLALSEPARLVVPPGRSPPQGAIIEAVVRVDSPRPPSAPGGFDEAAYLGRQGIHVVLHADRFELIGRRGGVGGLADRLRGRLARSLAPGLGGERRAVVAGIVLGEDEGLEPELSDRFRASGLFHLLAVSGQNVAYVVAGALLLAWLVGIPRWAGELGAIGAVLAYVLAVGWQPSVVRAGVAGILTSLAWLCSRARDRWYFLLLGAAVLLAWNPYAILEPGFQLSFGAVAAIFVLVPRIQKRLEGYPIPRRLATVVAISAACGAATAPILMVHFDAVPLFTVASNAAAAPVVAPILGLALAAAAVDPFAPGAAVALAWLNGWLAAYLAAVARFFGGLPHAQLTSWQALMALTGAVLFVLLLLRLPRPRAPKVAVLLVAATVLVAGWKLHTAEPPLAPPTGLRITFLDVGQGDATLLQVPEGSILVDEGPPEADVAGQLRRLGVRRLEALVMTHPSRDNIGGAERVLEQLDVRLVLDPALPFENPYGKPALAAARRRGIPVSTVRAGAVYRLGRLRLRVLWPDGSAHPSEDPNDHATVILASYGRVDALLPADAESNATLPLHPPPAEILKVAHHGSADPGLGELLARARPRVAVISVGARNDYGHPTPATLHALAAFSGLELYRTDLDGRVTVESDGTRITVRKDR